MAEQIKKPRMLPYNLEAEQSILGCIFLSVEAQALCFSKLKVEDFYSNAHKKIFDAMLMLYRENSAVDYVTLSKKLETEGTLEEAGGISYIVDLTNVVPSAANFKEYYEIVKNDSTLRDLIEACQTSMNYCFENLDAKQALNNAEKLILDLSKEHQTSELTHISEGLTEVISRMEKLTSDPLAFKGIKTGFPTLDSITNGFHKGDLILLAARPGIGKTSLALNICDNAALYSNATVAIFSLEMPMSQIAQRAMCSVAQISMEDATRGTQDSNTWETVFQAKDIISKANIFVDDSSLTTPMQILSKCRRLKHERGLDLVMIDYLQLMKADGKVESRQQEVGDLTRNLKIIARELEVPIIVLSQLSREIEKRQDKRPQLSDLRESGSIEQDADMVMFISRENEINEIDAQEVEVSIDEDCQLVIAKHRNGKLATIPLKWAAQYTKFYEPKHTPVNFEKKENQPQPTQEETITPVEDSSIDEVFE